MKIASTSYVPPAIVPTYTKHRQAESSQEHGKVSISEQATARLDAAREIMGNHDVRNLSYNELSKMAKELYDKGLVNETDYAHMTKPPGDFSSVTGQAEPDLNERRDYIDMYQNKLAWQRSTGADDRSIQFNEHMLALFAGLDSITKAP